MLEQLKKDLENTARLAPEYSRETRNAKMINIFADKYCEACDTNDDYNKNVYYSCLMLKFWDRVTKLYAGQDKHYGEQIRFLVKNKQLTIEDVFNKVSDCIDVACSYRKWKETGSKTNAQACINQVISSRAAGELLRPFNLKKDAGKVYEISLDDVYNDDNSITVGDTVGKEDDYKENLIAIGIVQSAIDKNKIIEAIIFDNFAFADCQKYEKETYTVDEDGEEKEYSRQVGSFWAYKLVKELKMLNKNYFDYFMSTYNVDSKKLKAALSTIKAANSSKLYEMIESSQNFGKSLLAYLYNILR